MLQLRKLHSPANKSFFGGGKKFQGRADKDGRTASAQPSVLLFGLRRGCAKRNQLGKVKDRQYPQAACESGTCCAYEVSSAE